MAATATSTLTSTATRQRRRTATTNTFRSMSSLGIFRAAAVAACVSSSSSLSSVAFAFAPPPRARLRSPSRFPLDVAGTNKEAEAEVEPALPLADQYSRCLTPTELRRSIWDEYGRYRIVDDRPKWQKLITRPLRALRGGGDVDATKKPGALILLRCGESEWTSSGRFTGWADPVLTAKGIDDIEHAGRLLLSEGYDPDVVYTSRLRRAVKSTWTILYTIGAPYLPVYKSWRLNERHYGALTSLKKSEAAEALGADVVQAWRNSLTARPPPMKKDDQYYAGNDRRYDDLTEDLIPLTESLADCMERARPLWEYGISRELRKGNTVLVVAHTNTLRGLMKVIDGIGDEEIQEVSMPSRVPFVYKFDADLKPLPPSKGKVSQAHTSGIFLEKPGMVQAALKREQEWNEVVPGSHAARVTALPDALLKLKEEQDRRAASSLEWGAAETVVDPNDDGELTLTVTDDADKDGKEKNGDDDAVVTGATFDEDDGSEFEGGSSAIVPPTTAADFGETTPVANVKKTDEEVPGVKFQRMGESKDPVVVFIRHGRTPHNNMGLFTGWEDPPLAPDGVEDAKNAGRLLKMHGFEFDVVYTSWLVRAIQTAVYCVDELDTPWLPMIKSWRLNERMYGSLTGKSKQMIANEYGEEQLKKWRRGFKVQPPPVSSYSLNYPGNDYRRTKYVKDLRISFTETMNRSWEAKSLQIHRKFPKCESLWDTMQRSIPFYTERIVPEAVNKGKRVLITSHENAIRGILMHLCEIPEEAMNQLHLPNGLPLVYSPKYKCISLLDDGSGRDPMEVHDFGPAAQYLFRPCELPDDFYGETTTPKPKSKWWRKQKSTI